MSRVAIKNDYTEVNFLTLKPLRDPGRFNKRLALRYDRSENTITALARLVVTLLTARHLSND